MSLASPQRVTNHKVLTETQFVCDRILLRFQLNKSKEAVTSCQPDFCFPVIRLRFDKFSLGFSLQKCLRRMVADSETSVHNPRVVLRGPELVETCRVKGR